jgi:hypothetical protein
MGWPRDSRARRCERTWGTRGKPQEKDRPSTAPITMSQSQPQGAPEGHAGSRCRFHCGSCRTQQLSMETPKDGKHLPNALPKGEVHGRHHPRERPGRPEGRAKEEAPTPRCRLRRNDGPDRPEPDRNYSFPVMRYVYVRK